MEARYYVYALIDPRDEQPFYIGKGTGARVKQHVKDAKAGRVMNMAKHARIVEIEAAGMQVIETVLCRFDMESAALEEEAWLIQSVPFLTNSDGHHPRVVQQPSNEELLTELLRRKVRAGLMLLGAQAINDDGALDALCAQLESDVQQWDFAVATVAAIKAVG